ncbi:MAG: type IV pilus twitching motility protein PilT, partial [Oscillospiraceae bacterium]
MTFEEFIMQAREMDASDIHLTVGQPTVVRVNGELRKFQELSDQVVNRTILSILTAEQEKALTEGNDVDFSFELKNGARQRVNVFRQGGRLACCIRLLNQNIPTLDELKMPPVLLDLAKKRRGLVLVTGPTGAGKSTTLAAMIEHINKTRACHVITIEDPIEYRYAQEKATIHQREIGRDVPSFSYALRSALREDPDVILIGEMRDYETISLAMTAAETGHLVF